jgi:DNA polymerase-4
VGDLETLSQVAKKLLAATNLDDVKIRLLGISVSNFGELQPKARKDGPAEQLKLF